MKMKKIAALVLSAILLIAVLCGCGKAGTSSETSSGKSLNSVSVTIKLENGEEKEYKYQTDKKYLGDVLFENGLVKEEEYKSGFYTYIDGVRADYNEDKAWWCVYENGESAMAGMNELIVDNNDEFEIVHTPA